MQLTSIKGKIKKRVGRGLSAGQGKTAGRGTKGQKSRSGFNIPRKFEGGQTPLSMRLPALPGFKSHKKKAEVVSLDAISTNYKVGETVDIKSLTEKGIVSGKNIVKILNNGKLTVAVKLGADIKTSKPVVDLFAKAATKPEKTGTNEEKNEVKKAKTPKTPAQPKTDK